MQSVARTIMGRALLSGREFKRILLVEDDAELAAMLKEFLNHVSGMVLMKPFHLEDLLQTILLLFRDLEDTSRRLTLLPDGARVALPFPTATGIPPALPA